MPSESFDFLATQLADAPFHGWLRPELIAVDDATSEIALRLPIRHEFRRIAARPEVHGGVLAAFADIAGHAAIAVRLRHGVPTIDMRVDYLRPAAGAFLIATATVVKLGRMIGLTDVKIVDPNGKLVVTARGAFMTRDD